MAGAMGINPDPFTLRQLVWMIEGRTPQRNRTTGRVSLATPGAAAVAANYFCGTNAPQYQIDSKTGRMTRT